MTDSTLFCGRCNAKKGYPHALECLGGYQEELSALKTRLAEAEKLVEFWRSKSRERIAGMDFRSIVASVAVEMDAIGGGGSSASNVRTWAARLSDALAGLPEDDAESRASASARLAEELASYIRVLHKDAPQLSITKRLDMSLSSAARALVEKEGNDG